MKLFKKKIKKWRNIDYDDISLVDSKNLSNFDVDKFESVIEEPLSKKNLLGIFFVFLFIIAIFTSKSFYMQIIEGENYLKQAKGNFIKSAVLFSNRGVIFDRNGEELAWNEKNIEAGFANRRYIEEIGFSHLLGFLSHPQKDKFGNFFKKEYVGKSGIEKYLNDKLNGLLGRRILSVDAFGNIISDNIIEAPRIGKNVYLSVDRDIQREMAIILNEFMKERKYEGGVGILMSVEDGQIISKVSLPEYSSQILSDGDDEERIKSYILNEKNPFINRATVGEFAPGSITKPFIALKALKENIFNPNKKFYIGNKIVIPNPYHPDNPSIFRDFRDLGPLNLNRAIAQSSNVFFYVLAGGYRNKKGLGIDKMHANFVNFSFGEKTEIQYFIEKEGIVPSREWKKDRFGTNWTIGNTYHTAIGQFGFLITPMQAIVAVSAIANNGKILRPQIIKDSPKSIRRKLNFSEEHFKLIRTAMRETVLSGTTQSLNLPYIKIASKSGTAERGRNLERINSWIIGFFPYDNPKYAFVFLAENGYRKEGFNPVSIASSRFFKRLYEKDLLYRLQE